MAAESGRETDPRSEASASRCLFQPGVGVDGRVLAQLPSDVLTHHRPVTLDEGGKRVPVPDSSSGYGIVAP